MKRERTVLTVLGAVFLVELAIGVPALRSNLHNDDALPTMARTTNALRTTHVAASTPTPTPSLSPAPEDSALAIARLPQPAAATPSAPSPAKSKMPIRARRKVASIAWPRQVAIVDDLPATTGGASFTYSSHWEHVRAMDDGRTAGTSSRSYRADARATLRFTGTEVRIFGVCGPHGGRAQLTIDGRSAGPIDFYASAKEPHMLVYRSPRLLQGDHEITISVAAASNATTKRYVNIDGAEVDS